MTQVHNRFVELCTCDMKDLFNYSFLPNYNLESFVINHSSQTNIGLVEDLIRSNFENTDILMIRSLVGCGATHLLFGIANKLESQLQKVSYLNLDNFPESLNPSNRRRNSLPLDTLKLMVKREISTAQFLVIDNFPNQQRWWLEVITDSESWLRLLIENFISAGGKLLCAQSEDDHANQQFSVVMFNRKIDEIHLSNPSKDLVRKVATRLFGNHLVESYLDKVYHRNMSMREVEAVFVAISAQQQLNKHLDIGEMLERMHIRK